jgi:hypothetical protein
VGILPSGFERFAARSRPAFPTGACQRQGQALCPPNANPRAALYITDERLQDEAIRVINGMRRNSEPLPPEDRDYSIRWSQLWNIYYSRLLNGTEQPSFLSALEPADHLATFRWLFPEDKIPESKRMLYRFFLGNFQELAGHPVVALETFRELMKALPNDAAGPLAEKTAAAVMRLSKLNGAERRIKMR